jgi:hypothetical protein
VVTLQIPPSPSPEVTSELGDTSATDELLPVSTASSPRPVSSPNTPAPAPVSQASTIDATHLVPTPTTTALPPSAPPVTATQSDESMPPDAPPLPAPKVTDQSPSKPPPSVTSNQPPVSHDPAAVTLPPTPGSAVSNGAVLKVHSFHTLS